MNETIEKQDQLKYEEIIKQFIIKNNIYSKKDINDISINFKNLGGGMNKNYLVEIKKRARGKRTRRKR